MIAGNALALLVDLSSAGLCHIVQLFYSMTSFEVDSISSVPAANAVQTHLAAPSITGGLSRSVARFLSSYDLK